MVPKILERVMPKREAREAKRSPKIEDPVLKDLAAEDRERKLKAFDEIMRKNPAKINDPDVFSAIQGDKDLVRHAVLKEYHVDMDDKTYKTFREIVKNTLIRNPLDAIQLLTEITEKNMKRKESIERTLDLFDSVLAALPARMNEEEEQAFLKFYGKFKRKMREFASRSEEHARFGKKMIVKSGNRVARTLVRIADNQIKRAKDLPPEEQFRAWKAAYGLKKEALWLLQKTAKHGGGADLDAIISTAIAPALRSTNHHVSVPLGKEKIRRRFLKEQANTVTKIINRGLQNDAISVPAALRVLELATPALGPYLHEGVATTVADLAGSGRVEHSRTLLRSYLKNTAQHNRGAYAHDEIDRFAEVLAEKLAERGVDRETVKQIEGEINRFRKIVK